MHMSLACREAVPSRALCAKVIAAVREVSNITSVKATGQMTEDLVVWNFLVVCQ